MSVKQAIDSGTFNEQDIDTSVVNATTVNATTVNATTVNAFTIVNTTTLRANIISNDNEDGLIFNCPNGLEMRILNSTGGVNSVLTSGGTYASWAAIPYPSITVSNLSYQTNGNLLIFNKPNNMNTAMAMINITASTTSPANVYNVAAFQVNQVDNTGAIISTRVAPFNFVDQASGAGRGAITVFVPINCVSINVFILAENITSFFTYVDCVKCS